MSTTAPTENTCGYTQLKNISGGELHFSYLGYHGATLTDLQSWYQVGNIWSFLAAAHPGIKGRRMVSELMDDINQGRLSIEIIPTGGCGQMPYEGVSSSSSSNALVPIGWSSSSGASPGEWWKGESRR